ncbi:MAG TPA: TetR/AcrR family transcriptional regulator [Ureibacillus sp.]|nr:TetR/AcrR family transcriptional regulator [Ureibacillus sp.]
MNTHNTLKNQNNYSFIEQARRGQIVDCAIDTIVELGYAQCSIGQIAKRANISKGVISYHFSSKEEIFEQIIKRYDELSNSIFVPQFDMQLSPRTMLQKYIKSYLEFVNQNRKLVYSCIEIEINSRTKEGNLQFSRVLNEKKYETIEYILLLGMKDGSFRRFSKQSRRVMAQTIESVINGFSIEVIRNSTLDVTEYINEQLMIFDLATRVN